MLKVVTENRRSFTALLPGLALAGLATVVALAINHVVPTVSPLLIAILLGAVLANVMHLPDAVRPGLAVAAKRLLRIGIVLLGLQVMVGDVLHLGLGMVLTIVAVVVVGLLGGIFVGRALGLTEDQRLLIATGFSICGAAAVAAVDGVLDADDDDTATAVALVVLFGTLMIPIVPALAQVFGLDAHQAGLWAGTSIHEVAQVVAAAGIIGGGALQVGVIVKLGRVLMLAPVMAVLSWLRRRELQRDRNASVGTPLPPLMPLFVAGFIAMVALRSLAPLPGWLLSGAKWVEVVLLSAAMFALGTGVQRSIVKQVGWRPLALATATTVLVAAIGYGGIIWSS